MKEGEVFLNEECACTNLKKCRFHSAVDFPGEVSKQVLQQHRGAIQDLFILSCLKKGLRPSQIAKQFSLNKKSIQNHLSSLKRAGMIKKIGYGVWEISEKEVSKQVLQSTQVAKNQVEKMKDFFKPDTVRGHAFVFRFELPKDLRNWDRREELLTKAGIRFSPLKIFGGGQKLIFQDRKVWLTDKSIIIYELESFMADLASQSHSKAINHFIELLRGLERHLQANLQIHKSRFKVSRQHYALIKNALAKQYNQEGKKLECIYPGEGLWFLIDNSFNLHEAETVHPKSAVKDNEKVQDFFNGIKETEGFTPQFVTQSLGTMSEGFNMYAKNIESHIKAIQDLGAGVAQYNQGIAELLKVVKELKK